MICQANSHPSSVDVPTENCLLRGHVPITFCEFLEGGRFLALVVVPWFHWPEYIVYGVEDCL